MLDVARTLSGFKRTNVRMYERTRSHTWTETKVPDRQCNPALKLTLHLAIFGRSQRAKSTFVLSYSRTLVDLASVPFPDHAGES